MTRTIFFHQLVQSIKLDDIIYRYCVIFYILTFILNSNIEIDIVVEFIQNIGAVELFTLLYIHMKNFVLSILTQIPRRYFQQKIILISSSDNSTTNFFLARYII